MTQEGFVKDTSNLFWSLDLDQTSGAVNVRSASDGAADDNSLVTCTATKKSANSPDPGVLACQAQEDGSYHIAQYCSNARGFQTLAISDTIGENCDAVVLTAMCASNAVDTCGKIGSECAPFTIGPSGMDCCDEFACKQVGDSEVYKCALPSASCIQDGDQCSLSSTCCGDSSTCQPDGALGNLVCKSTTSQPSCGDSGSQCGNAGQPDCCGGLQCQLPAGASDAVCLAPAPTCSANQFTCGSTCVSHLPCPSC